MAEERKVAALDELPEQTGLVVQAGRQEVALFKVGETVYALENECPHREGPIGEGDLDGEIVTCPFHAWQINVRTGEVEGIPGLCSRSYPCRVENGAVYVEI